MTARGRVSNEHSRPGTDRRLAAWTMLVLLAEWLSLGCNRDGVILDMTAAAPVDMTTVDVGQLPCHDGHFGTTPDGRSRCSGARATLAFEQRLVPTSGISSVGISLGDLNGDAHLDVLFAHPFSDTIDVFLGDGRGGLSLSTRLSTGRHPDATQLVDLNRDGRLDCVVVCYIDWTIRLYNGNGCGFADPKIYPVPPEPGPIALADLNDDDFLDVVVGDSIHGSLLLNDRAGSLQPATPLPPYGHQLYSVLSADLNGDQHSDLIVSYGKPLGIDVLLADGHSGFVRRRLEGPEFPSVPGPYGVFSEREAAPPSIATSWDGYVAVWRNDGGARFTKANWYEHRGIATGMTFADVDCDGLADILISSGHAELTVLRGTRDGAFLPPLDFDVDDERAAGGIVSADFDEDGRPDVLVSNALGSGLHVFLNRSE